MNSRDSKKRLAKIWKDTKENTRASLMRSMNCELRILLILRKVEKKIIIILKILNILKINDIRTRKTSSGTVMIRFFKSVNDLKNMTHPMCQPQM